MLFQCWPAVFDIGTTLNNIGSMPRDSWVGVHECQQSVAGGLATFSHPSLPHLTQLCYVTQYNN